MVEQLSAHIDDEHTEAETSLDELHQEVQLEQQAQEQTHHAFEFAQHVEVAPDPKIQGLMDRVLKKCLDDHVDLQKPLLGKSLAGYQQEIYKTHPELWHFLTFQIGINNFSCDTYQELTPTEKLKLLAFHGAVHDMLPWSIGLKNEQGRFDTVAFQKRYANKLESVVQDIASTFMIDQWSHAGQTLVVMQKEYGFTLEEAKAFKAHLEKIAKAHAATQPEQWNMVWYMFAFVAGVAVTLLWVMVYDRITNPKWMAETQLWPINLGDPALLAKLVTAEQPFTVNGQRTESLYDTTGSGGIEKIAKDLINAVQSRTVTMSLDGKVWVEYDFEVKNGATFTYDPKTKLISVQLPHPTFTIRQQKATVLARNSEWIEVSKFNNTEQTLLDELNEQALQKVETQQGLIDMSMKQTADIVHAMYSPVLKNFNKQIIGVQVTVSGKSPVIYPKG